MKLYAFEYSTISENKEELFKYLFHKCECFSLVENDNVNSGDQLSIDFSLQLKKYILYETKVKNEYPPFLTKEKFEILRFYKNCKSVRDLMRNDIDFWWNNHLWHYEDICFYKNRKVWFNCIDHEEYAAMYPDQEDEEFLIGKQIRFRNAYGLDIDYRLPFKSNKTGDG